VSARGLDLVDPTRVEVLATLYRPSSVLRREVRHARPRDRGAVHRARPPRRRGEVAKKLALIAALVLAPSLIVGFARPELRVSVRRRPLDDRRSTGLVVLSTLVQLAIFRWRRWI